MKAYLILSSLSPAFSAQFKALLALSAAAPASAGHLLALRPRRLCRPSSAARSALVVRPRERRRGDEPAHGNEKASEPRHDNRRARGLCVADGSPGSPSACFALTRSGSETPAMATTSVAVAWAVGRADKQALISRN